MTTLHLAATDFDAYLPERAASNAFTRPRLELKQRMLAWARVVEERLAEMGVALEVTGSDEHPNVRNGRRVDCQRVFFWRDATARADLERLIDHKRTLAARLGEQAHKNHAYLGLRLDSEHVDVSVELHAEAWVDLRNLRERVADPSRALELVSALEALPEQFSVGLAGDASMLQASKSGTNELRALLDRVDREGKPLWIGWSVPREVAVTHSEILDTQLEDAIVALGPVFKLIAWAADNDLVVLDREWDAAKADRARAHEEAERDKAEWEERREAERRARKNDERAERASAPTRKTGAPASDRDLEKKDTSSDKLPVRPLAKPPRMAPRAAARGPRVIDTDPSVPIEKGTRVLVLAGAFEGKLGVVQELDARGGARVMLGLLAMKLEVKDLVASVDPKDRPVLASSHRKPLPAR